MAQRSRTTQRVRSSPLPERLRRPNVLAFAGTRPEVLKLAPILARARGSSVISIQLCVSGQQGHLAHDIARELGVKADHEISHEGRPASLSQSMGKLMGHLDEMVAHVRPAGILVQGDTTTAMAGAFVAFHRQLPCFHVEAGLRTPNPHRPFPEEMNRRLITRLATLHFAPTSHAERNLLAEGVAEAAIRMTGNTIVDALQAFGRQTAPVQAPSDHRARVVVTLHRRENAEVVEHVVAAVRVLAARDDIEILWVAHPNATGKAAAASLSEIPNVRLVPPFGYRDFVALLASARAVLTDSGGVQEEAPILGIPVVVLRRETDRPEAIAAGNAELAGTDPERIVEACRRLLDDPAEHERRSKVSSPFGDGHAGERIVTALEEYFPR